MLKGAAAFTTFAAFAASRRHSRLGFASMTPWILLALELVVSVSSGAIMGVAATSVEELFSGILRPPMTPISPAPRASMLLTKTD